MELTKRDFTQSMYGFAAAGILTPLFWSSLESEPLPKIPEWKPIEPISPDSFYPPIGAPLNLVPKTSSLMSDDAIKQYVRGVPVAFQRAIDNGLLTPMQSVCDATGMGMPDLLALTYFESSMGLQKKVKADVAGAKQTASGVVQIIDNTFIGYAQKYGAQFKSAIQAHAHDEGARHFLTALNFVSTDKLDNAGYQDFLKDKIAAALKSVPKKYKGKKAESYARAQVYKTYSPNLKDMILSGRGSPFVSMLFASYDSVETCKQIDADACRVLQGSAMRMNHMFGMSRTLDFVNVWKKVPDTTLGSVFKLDGVPQDDSRWAPVTNNHLDSSSSVGNFFQQWAKEFSEVRAGFSARYDEFMRQNNEARQNVVASNQPFQMAQAEGFPIPPIPPARIAAGKPGRPEKPSRRDMLVGFRRKPN